MSANVNKIIEKAVGQVRTILVEAVQQVDEEARADLISQFNEAVGGAGITTVKARRVASSSPKKATKKTTKKAAKAKGDKPKRVVSAETRKKLAQNLAKARAAKAKKAKAEARAAKAEARAAAQAE